jgi:hypothetical protein
MRRTTFKERHWLRMNLIKDSSLATWLASSDKAQELIYRLLDHIDDLEDERLLR